MAAPSINASGNVGSPGGLTPLGRIVNVLTLGAAAHPHEAGQYWTGQAESLDPTTPMGLINMLGILIPGGRGGRPTSEQAGLLNSIYQSSRGQLFGGGNAPMPAIRPGSSGGALADHIGAPVPKGSGLVPGAMNPLQHLFGFKGSHPGDTAGLSPGVTDPLANIKLDGRTQPEEFVQNLPQNTQDRLPELLRILARNSIARRN